MLIIALNEVKVDFKVIFMRYFVIFVKIRLFVGKRYQMRFITNEIKD